MSKTTDHLAKAGDYLAIAESGDSKREAYIKAGREIQAWLDEDPRRTQKEAARLLATNGTAITRALQAFRTGEVQFNSGSNKRGDVARKVMSDPEQARTVIAALDSKQLDTLASAATDTLIERHRAERSEHTVRPTARELMGGDKFDPSELWADTPLISVSRAVDVLASRVQRAGGVILGALSQDEAYERLIQAERQISEIRAAVQEQIRDEVNV